jgi:hypothetical protein
MLRVALAVGLLIVGLAVGLASVAVHATWWGLPLALAATALTAYAAPGGWSARLPFVLGWAVVVGALAVPRGEGDFVIAGDVNGYALLGFGLVLVVAGFATLPAPGNNARSGAPSS